MTKFPQDDAKLVTFLRQYRPLVPLAKTNVETQLMHLIEKQSNSHFLLSHKLQKQFFWMISSCVATVVILTWGSHYCLKTANQFIKQPLNSPELEAFLVNSWNDVLEDNSLVSNTSHPEADWLLLENGETNTNITLFHPTNQN